MSNYLILTENTNSQWEDQTGVTYHYPLYRYRNAIITGKKFIYYRGKIRVPEYFGCGIIGKIIDDPNEIGRKAYAEILQYTPFEESIPFKIDNRYLEDTQNRPNYFRDGVRKITGETYNKILCMANFPENNIRKVVDFESQIKNALELSEIELLEKVKNAPKSPKKPKKTYTNTFDRNPWVVAYVLKRANGYCEYCNNFAPFFRKNGTPYLEVHHKIMLADGGPDTIENTIAVCPNCHRKLHYGK